MPLTTIALELVPPNIELGPRFAIDEAHKVLANAAAVGLEGRIRHVMIPGMVEEDGDRPVKMKPKMDVLDFWQLIKPELPGMQGLCTQVTSFLTKDALAERLDVLQDADFDGIAFVGVPRTISDGDGVGVAPTDALSIYADRVANRGVILIPTRGWEIGRFDFKCAQGATYDMTQLLYSDAIVGFLKHFAVTTEHRPEILLSFGFVPKIESKVGLINWLIQDPGNPVVAAEQEFVARLAGEEPAVKRALLLDLYKRVIDGVADLGFPISIHLEAAYGVSKPAFETFAAMLDYRAPTSSKRARKAE
ncbi:mycobacterial-type methylenetetrahydrofolate reductase [Mycolicibacterium phocaicum]|uniref:mycobacterial-type methylenetetrahydrofolate reductase n=1 Tax=Mycolicibacterium phocaicum TaxID=319706 RepID=UPI001CFC24D7|nr:mycobacterial-type methylenetetrahydrofolate reductase [Mycolicibacterium phocaicum]UCZ60146.1 mycobacterial-type methylenetetrahydrofolate reductase [Mycolicibacterium phocaicum]